ncbi:MAG: prepilin-type N-terminal cleavage/methylation domain-containing protein [Planctomycetota bacterium]
MRSSQGGMTLIELLVASMLGALVMAALVRFVGFTLNTWSGSEIQRSRSGSIQATLDRVAGDLTRVHPGALGDFLLEWVPFNLDEDPGVDRCLPRLRFGTRPSAEHWERLVKSGWTDAEREQFLEAGFGVGSPGYETQQDLPQVRDILRPGLAEVLWVLLPETRSGGEAAGVLYRMEQRRPEPPAAALCELSLGAEGDFLETLPLEPVAHDVLWWDVVLLESGVPLDAAIGSEAGQARRAWDGLGAHRVNREVAPMNLDIADLGARHSRPRLPERVRLELEIETAADRDTRPRLAVALDREAGELEVTRGERLPEPGAFLRIDGEWLQLQSVDGDRAAVLRGQRGTLAALHERGARVHFGAHGERLVRIDVANLSPDGRAAR